MKGEPRPGPQPAGPGRTCGSRDQEVLAAGITRSGKVVIMLSVAFLASSRGHSRAQPRAACGDRFAEAVWPGGEQLAVLVRWIADDTTGRGPMSGSRHEDGGAEDECAWLFASSCVR